MGSMRIRLSTVVEVLLVCMCGGGLHIYFLYVQMSNRGVGYAFTAIYLVLVARNL